MSEFTQGVCADGAAILKDGVMLTIEEIIDLLRQGDALMGRGEPVEHQFYDPSTSRWHNFMNEQHRRNTADAGYEIRALYAQAPAVDGAVLLDAAIKAHMAGQIDAGVDPSYSNAQQYAYKAIKGEG